MLVLQVKFSMHILNLLCFSFTQACICLRLVSHVSEILKRSIFYCFLVSIRYFDTKKLSVVTLILPG